MNDQTNNRIREENWKEKFEDEFVKMPKDWRENHGWTVAYVDSRADKLMSFIDELLKSQEHKLREELVEKIEKIPTGNHKRADMRDEILSIIKE